MSQQKTMKLKKLAVVLSLVFVLALIMGPGPGLYLVNPDPGDPNAMLSLFNVPVIYIWTVFWSFVQAAVVIIAYFKLWDNNETNKS